jgi:tetrahydromethanopterin S-methyltransferase subunit D
MDGETIGMIGGLAGGAIGVAGGAFGAWRSYRMAKNDAQRRFYLRIYPVFGVALAAILALGFLSVSGVLPKWIYPLVMTTFFAALAPFIIWMNRRIAALDDAKDEAVGQ